VDSTATSGWSVQNTGSAELGDTDQIVTDIVVIHTCTPPQPTFTVSFADKMTGVVHSSKSGLTNTDTARPWAPAPGSATDTLYCGAGNTVTGWVALDAAGNPLMNAANVQITLDTAVEQNVTFTPKCEAIVNPRPITVKYEANTPCDKCDSTATGPDPSSQKYEMKIVRDSWVISNPKTTLKTQVAFLPGTDVSVYGYAFQGWAYKTRLGGHSDSFVTLMADPHGKIMVPDSIAKCDSRGNNCTVTLYAQWKPVRIKVLFDANAPAKKLDVKGMPHGDMFKFCDSVKIPKNTPSAKGWTFVGWNTAADGTGTAYAPGDKFLLNSFVSHRDGSNTFTLYAQWSDGSTPVTTPTDTDTDTTTPDTTPASPVVPTSGGSTVAPTGGSVAGSAATAGIVGMLMLVAAGGVFMVSRRRLAIH